MRRVPALLACLLVLAAPAGCGLFGDNGPDADAAAFATAWSAGDDAGAAALTDDPQAAAGALTAVRSALGGARVAATVGQVRTATDRATASVDVAWDLGQNRSWRYLDDLDLVPAPDAARSAGHDWVVHWAPTVVAPRLGARQQLALTTTAPDPAPIVDRNGSPLLAATPVVTVLLDRVAAGDLAAVAGSLAAALGPIDRQITVASITDGAQKTPDGQAYTVATLRQPDYTSVKDAIHDLPGVRFTQSDRLLGPSAGYAQQILPAVRTALAAQLDGVAGWSVDIVDAAGGEVATLASAPPQPGTTVAVTLDRAVQSAAEDAVETLPQATMLVAIAPSTGAVLAVAQNGPADVGGALALTGRYPPGSTFKMVTATAAIATQKLTPDTPVACPGEIVIGGRAVPNENKFDLGTVPLRTAFAKSCNTTFARLGSTLGPDALPTAALSLGVGADYAVPGIVTVTGSVPSAADPVQRAENGFGQGEVLATPFGMALAAATVAHGATVVPQLVSGHPTAVTTPATAPDPAVLAQLRPMMRQVVTDGTATALRALGEVYGKTGTAEYTDDGRAHGWFVGYRGDVAFAVLVVDGGTSTPAVGIAQRFLTALG